MSESEFPINRDPVPQPENDPVAHGGSRVGPRERPRMRFRVRPVIARRRPGPAASAAVMLIVFGVAGSVLALLLAMVITESASHGESVPGLAYALVVLGLVLSIGEAVSGVFVWQGRSWARELAICLCTVNIAAAVITLFTGAGLRALVGVAINGGLIGMLSNDEVVGWCQ